MLIFQNETHFYFFCQSVQNKQAVVQLYKSATGDNNGQMELLASAPLEKTRKELFLKIQAKGPGYTFYYATKKNKWIVLKDDVDAKFLSTQVAGGFVGAMYALYATSSGKVCKNKAYFNWFESKTND